jgi:hypothetical protein
MQTSRMYGCKKRFVISHSERFKSVGLWVKEALWVCLTAGHFQSDVPSHTANLSCGISRSPGFAENALKGYAKWMGDEVRPQGFLEEEKWPSSAPDRSCFFIESSSEHRAGLPGTKVVPGFSSPLRDLPEWAQHFARIVTQKGGLSPVAEGLFDSLERTADSSEELAKKHQTRPPEKPKAVFPRCSRQRTRRSPPPSVRLKHRFAPLRSCAAAPSSGRAVCPCDPRTTFSGKPG